LSILDEMTPQEAYDWEWNALPRWSKAVSLGVGGPAFAILTWSVFDADAVSETTQTICFGLLAGVALVQVYCLNKIVRRSRR